MFTIRFRTLRYRPDLQVTLRNDVDGWDVDVAGSYEEDDWLFRLAEERYEGGFFFKFVLEEQYWMEGGDLHLEPEAGGDYVFGGDRVKFPPVDEVLVESGYVPQRFFAPSLDETRRFDVIVVGSGFGGGVVADQLADLGREVLVLELGSYLFPSHVGNLPRRHAAARRVDKNVWGLWNDFKVTNYRNAPGSDYAGGQGFNLGGRSVFWGGLIPRMTWWELDRWPQPVRWYLEDHGYDLAEQLLRKAQVESEYQARVLRELRLALPEWVPLVAPMALHRPAAHLPVVSSGIFSTADLLLESRLSAGAAGAANLTVNLNHGVVAVETAGDRATAVVAHDLISDRRRRFEADAVVLAAGSLESPKLVQLSGLEDPNGKAGTGLTDHPIFFNHFAIPASSPLYESHGTAKVLLRHRDAAPDRHRYNVLLEIGTDFNQGRFVDPDILEEHLRVRGETLLAEIVFLFDAPLQDGNVLRQEGPSYAKPLVAMEEAAISAQEWGEIVALKDSILGLLGAEPLEGGGLDLVRAGLGGVAHEAGTLRMGTDPGRDYRDGVVDTDLRFLAYDNLYACDLSVFPSSPAANPSLTLSALALRLAEHLARPG